MRSATLRGRVAFGLAVGAVAYGLLIVAGAFVLPAYEGSSCTATPSGTAACTSTSATLVGVNGFWVLGVVALPALVAVGGWLLLHRACATGSGRAMSAVWGLVVGLLVLSWLTGFTIGPFLLPLPILLAASAVLVDFSR